MANHMNPPPKKGLARLLSPIADVHDDEVASVMMMTLIMFLTLGAYYMLKTAREVFILTEGGAEVKSYSAAGQAVLLLFLVPAYGAFASRVNRTRLVGGVTLFFASHLILFIAASRMGLHIGVPYFLWLGIVNVMVIAQFWAFANDLYTLDQGKRLFPLIGVGSSLGAWVGAMRAGHIMTLFGPMRLLIAAGLLLVVCAALAMVVSRRQSARGQSAAKAVEKDEAPVGGEGGFEMIRKDRYLLLITALTVLLNVVNTSGEYLFARYIVDQSHALYGTDAAGAAAREQFVGSVYSRFFSTVNLVGFLLQLFVVSRVFKYLGVGKSLFVHPAVALAGYLLMLRAPSLALIQGVKVADNSLDYSLGNTTKQALWLPTSRAAKYKAKQAVDSFFMRLGDVLQAGLVFAGERIALGVQGFAAVNVVLVGLWLAVAAMLNVSLNRKTQVAPGTTAETVA